MSEQINRKCEVAPEQINRISIIVRYFINQAGFQTFPELMKHLNLMGLGDENILQFILVFDGDQS